MDWTIYLIISTLVLIASVIFAIVKARMKYKSGRILTPSKILFGGVIISSVILFLPIYANTFKTSNCGPFETFFISVHNMIRLFLVDGEFSFITSNLEGASYFVSHCYTVLFSILFVFAPVLTFGFVLSFFKNVSAYFRYITHFHSDTFIFSELNEKSLALAKSLKKKKGRFFVFADVFEREEEQSYELVEKAKELGSVCFKKDIITIKFSLHSKKSELNFFAIGEDQAENLGQTLKLVEKYADRENTNLYVFSTQLEAELLLANTFNSAEKETKIKVRRVNEVQSLIMRNLYENGYDRIFDSAYDDGSGVKKINAVVVGMGMHGTEMTKALSWFCQMDGYLVEINSFDISEKAKDLFSSQCPELMAFSGKMDVKGDAKYTVNIHSGVDVDTFEFDSIVNSLPRTTYVFVALGNDEKNISTAVKLRTLCKRMGYAPKIQAVVYNSDKKEALTGITDYNGNPYDIDFIGDINSSYSEDVILDSDVEEEALRRHLMWGDEGSFWKYNYNYKSSIASAIHKKMKMLCGIPEIEKAPKDRSPENLINIRVLEHCRWNAYMRSEGYVFSGDVHPESRDDLAKMHNCLVPFDELLPRDKEKDDD